MYTYSEDYILNRQRELLAEARQQRLVREARQAKRVGRRAFGAVAAALIAILHLR